MEILEIKKDPSLRHKLNRLSRQLEFKRRNGNKFSLLTSREVEVMELLAAGLNNPEVAEKLFVSRHTIEQHRKNINRKLSIHSNYDFYQYALAFDLI